MIFCVLEGLEGDSTICVNCCGSWDVRMLSLLCSFPIFSSALTIASCSAWLLEHLL